MIEDVKKNKMSSKILVHLIEYIITELYEKIYTTRHNLEEYQNNIAILHEIEKIYKEIYDRGYTSKLERKLKKFELAPGYDMSTNANLLTIKQKALEKEKERLDFLLEEEKKLQEQYDETFKLAKKENWYPTEPYYR